MLLTISTTYAPATDLGFLLHKHPDRLHEVPLSFGVAHVVYPEASERRCTVALLVDVDPVGLVRDRKGGPRGRDASLGHYVNDRPYAASSFLSVALGKVFGTALSGRSRERPELADAALPFEAHLPVVPCRGGEGTVLRRLFEPLGYEVTATGRPLDSAFPDWGPSAYFDVRLRGTFRVREILQHLFVLLPVLDDDKHYWVGDEEVDKLLRRGGDWLPTHPEKELIASRYLRHDRRLTDAALSRLLEEDAAGDPGEQAESRDAEEAAVERPISLGEQRLEAVVGAVRAAGAKTVVDLGCGEGRLVGRLLRDTDAKVTGMDVSHRALEVAARRLRLDTMTPRQRERVELFQGALTYRDSRLTGFDAAAVVEVIEHIDLSRLGAFERSVFGHARPRTVVLTTPNREYNGLFPTLAAGSPRHRDHRFEWTRAELADWAVRVASRYGYQVEMSGIGPADPEAGQPTQLAVFTLAQAS